jgi:UDP-2-acetamido-2,6-beta-L-arabino-hexul-4-ose reductase
MSRRRIVVTGAAGFIGMNLVTRLGEEADFSAIPIDIDSPDGALASGLKDADALVHLAGVNRPEDPAEFMSGNRGSVLEICDALESAGRRIPVILSSSIRAVDETDYGRSKRAAEDALLKFGERSGNPVHIFRLPNVFGKWCRPNYNSAVATFCHNLSRGIPIEVHDPAAPLSLVYIDDMVGAILQLLRDPPPESGLRTVEPVYETTVGDVADLIRRFKADRDANMIEQVGSGLTRALYATYVAALPREEFSHPLTVHCDERGVFVEMLKTRTSGQFSYFTAHPGVTRGGHYHHTKTEKFLVLTSEALFRFRNVISGETHEIRTRGGDPAVVETIPGWAHDITNIGDEILIAMIWANEVFDTTRPDTIAEKV